MGRILYLGMGNQNKLSLPILAWSKAWVSKISTEHFWHLGIAQYVKFFQAASYLLHRGRISMKREPNASEKNIGSDVFPSQSTLQHFLLLHRSRVPHWALVLLLLEGCTVPGEKEQYAAGHLEQTSVSWTTHWWDFWVAKEAVPEKTFIYILVFLLVLGRDYWTVKSSFQKFKAQKERSRRKLLIPQLGLRTFTQAGTLWDSHQLFQDTANRCLVWFFFVSSVKKKHTVPRQITVLFQLTVFVLFLIIELLIYFPPGNGKTWTEGKRIPALILSIFLGQWGWQTKV